eukprot:scaffold2611_cov133-Skeletonema_menzelii.AAC.6
MEQRQQHSTGITVVSSLATDNCIVTRLGNLPLHHDESVKTAVTALYVLSCNNANIDGREEVLDRECRGQNGPK